MSKATKLIEEQVGNNAVSTKLPISEPKSLILLIRCFLVKHHKNKADISDALDWFFTHIYSCKQLTNFMQHHFCIICFYFNSSIFIQLWKAVAVHICQAANLL